MKAGRRHISSILTLVGTLSPSTRLQTACEIPLSMGGRLMNRAELVKTGPLANPPAGAFFDYHPLIQNATVDVIDASHPSTSMLPAQWQVQDEILEHTPTLALLLRP
ncbi:hypothetical protein EDB86DRAFT_2936138 [Lactarius hatsudake]|nr:hypothetical protein EDB86DRAFT_2936138 [Lactarius hatsudake]